MSLLSATAWFVYPVITRGTVPKAVVFKGSTYNPTLNKAHKARQIASSGNLMCWKNKNILAGLGALRPSVKVYLSEVFDNQG